MTNNLFSKIDDLTRGEHEYLKDNDQCVFHGVYTPWDYTDGRNWGYSDTNQLIANLKIKMEHKGTNRWPHKGNAISDAARIIRSGIPSNTLDQITLVPVPPSAIKSDPGHDDRLLRVLSNINPSACYDIRELVIQTTNKEPAHSGTHYTPEELELIYVIDENIANPEPSMIAIFDDMLTTGASFKATQSVLLDRFPDAKVVGLFLSRRHRPTAKEIFSNLS